MSGSSSVFRVFPTHFSHPGKFPIFPTHFPAQFSGKSGKYGKSKFPRMLIICTYILPNFPGHFPLFPFSPFFPGIKMQKWENTEP